MHGVAQAFDDTAVALSAARLIGIVGYTPVLDAFPLSRRLVGELRQRLPDDGSIAIENMSWGPIHIVQRFQDIQTPVLKRLVLVGAASVSVRPGHVRAYRWKGGRLPEQAVQERVYEAVTGIVDIENTLVIGEYFGIWPPECFVVEADIPANVFGAMVMADNEKRGDDRSLTSELGFSPRQMQAAVGEMAAALAIDGIEAKVRLDEKVSTALGPGATFLRPHFADGSASGNGRVQ